MDVFKTTYIRQLLDYLINFCLFQLQQLVVIFMRTEFSIYSCVSSNFSTNHEQSKNGFHCKVRKKNLLRLLLNNCCYRREKFEGRRTPHRT